MNMWEAWRERIVQGGQFVPPQVWVASLFPTPYLFVTHRRVGYSIGCIPSLWSAMDWQYRTVTVWLN